MCPYIRTSCSSRLCFLSQKKHLKSGGGVILKTSSIDVVFVFLYKLSSHFVLLPPHFAGSFELRESLLQIWRHILQMNDLHYVNQMSFIVPIPITNFFLLLNLVACRYLRMLRTESKLFWWFWYCHSKLFNWNFFFFSIYPDLSQRDEKQQSMSAFNCKKDFDYWITRPTSTSINAIWQNFVSFGLDKEILSIKRRCR